MNCKNCGILLTEAEILSAAAKINGLKKSEAKANASRENGKKGGRPRENKTKNNHKQKRRG